jgi:hypothetical protein
MRHRQAYVHINCPTAHKNSGFWEGEYKDELERMWNEVALVYFKRLYLNLYENTDRKGSVVDNFNSALFFRKYTLGIEHICGRR